MVYWKRKKICYLKIHLLNVLYSRRNEDDLILIDKAQPDFGDYQHLIQQLRNYEAEFRNDEITEQLSYRYVSPSLLLGVNRRIVFSTSDPVANPLIRFAISLSVWTQP